MNTLKLNGCIIINPFLQMNESFWQAKRLKEEFELLGVDVEIISDAFIRTAISDGKLNCKISKDFVIYLDKDKYVSEILEKSGVRLFNNHNAIRVCDDKARTYISLANSGVNIPSTFFAPLCYVASSPFDVNYLKTIVDQLGLPLIIKECYGSMGKGVYKADTFDDVVKIYESLKTRPHLYQKYISERKGTDLRVICIGGRATSAMLRTNPNDFRSNIALGGNGIGVDLNDVSYAKFFTVAESVAKLLELDYCGIDLLFDKGGEPCVCEVNSNAFFHEMEHATGFNVAREYAKYVVSQLKNL